MITSEGINNAGQTHWKLHVPDEHCMPGLEVGIFATANGLMIGGELLPWHELYAAKLKALNAASAKCGVCRIPLNYLLAAKW